MQMFKRLDPLWLLLMVLGGLNWAIVAIFNTNVFSEVFGTGAVRDVAYCVVGFAALMYVPRALAGLRLDMGRVRPRGA
jgi:uncharacterized membrane protein YuzA (DUF378 family)